MAGIVDTGSLTSCRQRLNSQVVCAGSALLYLEQNAYSRYVALTKATLDSEVTGLLTVPSINNLQNLVLLLSAWTAHRSRICQTDAWPISRRRPFPTDAECTGSFADQLLTS
jgi:hypothetical protein